MRERLDTAIIREGGRKKKWRGFSLMGLALIALFLIPFPAFSAEEALTNDAVVKMTKAGLGEELVINKIRTTRNSFNMSVDEIMKLKGDGVSENVINEMINASAASTSSAKETAAKEAAAVADQQKAAALLQEERYVEAYDLMKEMERKGETVDNVQLLDAEVGRLKAMRDAKDPSWENAAIAVQRKIKNAQASAGNNADFWLVYARFSGLVGRERHIKGGLDRAFYVAPNYVKAHIAKGDIYSDWAINTGHYDMDSEGKSLREQRGMTAMAAYEAALKISGIRADERAAAYYKMAEVEDRIFSNLNAAKQFFKESVAAAPESRWGKLSAQRLKD